MNILLAGGSGFIGQHLSENLSGNHVLTICGRDQSLSSFKLKSGTTLPYYFTTYSIDSLQSIFNLAKPDVVIILASGRPKYADFTTKELVSNLSVANSLFEICLNNNVKNLICFSSMSVYPKSHPIPWNEQLDILPNNLYGLSKLLIEMSSDYYNSMGLNIINLRLAQVIGLGEEALFVRQIFLDNAIKKKCQIVIGSGQNRRQYIYVKDIVSLINSCLENLNIRGVFNVGMEGNYSILELAETINAVFDNDAGIKFQTIKFPTGENSLMDISKTKKMFSWEPKFNLRQAYFDIRNDLNIEK